MQFHSLKRKTKNIRSKQVGRGGTRGKTSGRGTKGQNARAGHKNRPELRDFIKRVPKLRGRGVGGLKSRQRKLEGTALKQHLAEKKVINSEKSQTRGAKKVTQ